MARFLDTVAEHLGLVDRLSALEEHRGRVDRQSVPRDNIQLLVARLAAATAASADHTETAPRSCRPAARASVHVPKCCEFLEHG